MAPKGISENIEEYLEVLYKFGTKKNYVSTTTLSKELGIAPASVTQMLKKLENLEYIEYTPYKGAILTDYGLVVSQKITRKHRILERFLKDVLKIKEENVHHQACEMEHSLSDEAERALCHMLKSPDTCPDNHLIPSCDFEYSNCIDCINDEFDIDTVKIRDYNLLAISQLDSGDQGEILFIRGDLKSFNQINDLGIKIGSKIQFNNEDFDYIFISSHDLSIKIKKSVANKIFVKLL